MAVSAAERRNTLAREEWIQRGIRGIRPLPPVTAAIGTTQQIKLDPLGLLTGLVIEVSGPVTIAGTVQTPGRQSPYCLLSQIRLADSLGVQRVVMTGGEAYAVQSIYDRQNGISQNGVMFQYPQVPTAIGAGTLDVSYRVPIAADPWRDLRGSMYMPRQTASYLTVTLAPQLVTAGEDAAVYRDGGGTVVPAGNFTIQVWQEFIDSAAPLPDLDVATLHYLTGDQQLASGLAGASEQLIDYPVNRAVRALVLTYANGGDQAIGWTTSMRQLWRSAYELSNLTATQKFIQQRRYLGGNDLPEGYWFFIHAPEVVPRYSREFQAGFTPFSAAAGGNLTFLFDTFGS